MASIALSEAYLWGRAVFRLSDDITASRDDVDDQVNAMLLAVAYRNVRRAAEMAAHHLPESAASQLRQAMEDSDTLAPEALAVRDMLEHFDEYQRGRGKLQQPGVHHTKRTADESLASGHLIFYERGETFTLVVGGHRLAVDSVRSATRVLIHGIHAAGQQP
jgi:hypothetical protein